MNIFKGNILTCDKSNNVYNYLVENEGKILFTGNELPQQYKDEQITDLGEKALIPAFADTHSHFASYAVLANALMVNKAKSNEEIKELIAQKNKNEKKNKTIIAFGANAANVAEKKLIQKKDIDEVAPDRHVVIITADGHSIVINSKTLNKLPKSIQSVRGYNADTGIIRNEAFYKVVDFLPKLLKRKDIIQFMQSAIDGLIIKGIGMVHAASGTGFPGDLDVDLIKWIARGQTSGFQMRIFFQTFDTDKVLKRGFTRLGGCFKTALDGSIGSRDAALLQPYEGTEEKGILYYTDLQLYEYLSKANKLGLQIAMHAIGDAAFEQATKTFKRVLDEHPRDDHRHGIIHACMPTEEGLKICKDYNIQIMAQPAFIDVEGALFQPMYAALGERVWEAEPYRKMLDYGLTISAGSDAPVTMPDPIEWLYKACNNPNEKNRMTIQEALRVCTYNGYYASFDEKTRGSLEKGKIADMVILSQNPYEVKKENLKEIKVEKTYLGGIEFKPKNKSVMKTIIKGMLTKGSC